MPSANLTNRTLMNKALRTFLGEMVPYVIQEVETAAGQPIETAAIEVFGERQGSKFLEELGNYDSNALAAQFALTRINLTVEFFWPIFKKRLRNKKVVSGALKQIAYAAVPGVAIDPEHEVFSQFKYANKMPYRYHVYECHYDFGLREITRA